MSVTWRVPDGTALKDDYMLVANMSLQRDILNHGQFFMEKGWSNTVNQGLKQDWVFLQNAEIWKNYGFPRQVYELW